MSASATDIESRLDDFRAVGVEVRYVEDHVGGAVRLAQFFDSLRWELWIVQGQTPADAASLLDLAWDALVQQDAIAWYVWVPSGGTDTYQAPPQRFMAWEMVEHPEDEQEQVRDAVAE